MSGPVIRTRAPSNIALVKYMGKKDAARNIPSNSSLSMTLSDLSTFVELRLFEGAPGMTWVAELPSDLPSSRSAWEVPRLNAAAQERFQRHCIRVQGGVQELLKTWGLFSDSSFKKLELRTANNFPASSGIASSASSFAAMTLAFAAATAAEPSVFAAKFSGAAQPARILAALSRQGSGSSCRSFAGPWVAWSDEDMDPISTSAMPEMAHFVILIRKEPKAVGSSEAHLRVQSSPLWQGRQERAEQRVVQVRNALMEGNLSILAQETWREAWEMHSLFHTSSQPFTYWQPGTVQGLHFFSQFMQDAEPPIVTLDAGPNIHLIVPLRNKELWRERLKKEFPESALLEDTPGLGANFVV